MSSISCKVNTINYLKLGTQRTICFCKSGIFSVAKDRNYLSYLWGLVFFIFFSSLICPELLQTNSLQEPLSVQCYVCVHVYKIIESDWLQYMRLSYSAENYWALKSTGNHKTSKLGKHMSVSVWKWVLVQEQLSIRRMSIVPWSTSVLVWPLCTSFYYFSGSTHCLLLLLFPVFCSVVHFY